MEMHVKMYFTVKVWKSPYKNIELAERFMHSPAERQYAVAIGCICKDVKLDLTASAALLCLPPVTRRQSKRQAELYPPN